MNLTSSQLYHIYLQKYFVAGVWWEMYYKYKDSKNWLDNSVTLMSKTRAVIVADRVENFLVNKIDMV